jgi:hypothetical protein
MQMYHVILQNTCTLDEVALFYTTAETIQHAVQNIVTNHGTLLATEDGEILVKPASNNPTYWENEILTQIQSIAANGGTSTTHVFPGNAYCPATHYYAVKTNTQQGFATWVCTCHHNNPTTVPHTTLTFLLPIN